MSGKFSTRARGVFAALAYVVVSACGGTSDITSPMDAAYVRISANVAGTPISTLVVSVTGDGFSQPLVFNADVHDNQAAATLAIPAGTARTFAVKAYDSQGEITHEGSKTVDVARGQNPPVSINLVPRNGHIAVEIHMGDYSVAIAPSAPVINISETVQLSAAVTAPNGDHPAPDVMWATVDPSIATVNSSGLVTGKRGGVVQIIATYAGVAGTMNVVVRDASAPLSYLGPLYPPPGGVTFTSGTGAAGTGTGIVNSYQGFDLGVTRYLAFGADATDMPAVMFNSTAGNTTIDPNARMTFTMDGTNPSAGTMRYVGQTFIPMAGGGSLTALTRFTLTLTQVVGGVETPIELEAAPGSWSATIGGVAKITNAFVAPNAMHARLFFEASLDNGVTWGPATTVFNSVSGKASTAASRTSFRGGFYYSY